MNAIKDFLYSKQDLDTLSKTLDIDKDSLKLMIYKGNIQPGMVDHISKRLELKENEKRYLHALAIKRFGKIFLETMTREDQDILIDIVSTMRAKYE